VSASAPELPNTGAIVVSPGTSANDTEALHSAVIIVSPSSVAAANEVRLLPPLPPPKRPPRGAKERLGLAALEYFYRNGPRSKPEDVLQAIGGHLTKQSLRAHRIEAAAFRRAAGIVDDAPGDFRIKISDDAKARFLKLYLVDDPSISMTAASKLCGFSDGYGRDLLRAGGHEIRRPSRKLLVDYASPSKPSVRPQRVPPPTIALEATTPTSATCEAYDCEEPVAPGRNCCVNHVVTTRTPKKIDLAITAARDKERSDLLKSLAVIRMPTPPPPENKISAALQSELDREAAHDRRISDRRRAQIRAERERDAIETSIDRRKGIVD
jgi:hypothetical protein